MSIDKIIPFSKSQPCVFFLKFRKFGFNILIKYILIEKKRKRECGPSKVTVSAEIHPTIPSPFPDIRSPQLVLKLKLFIRTLWCHYTTCFDQHCYGLFYRDGSDQIIDMLWCNYLEVFLWPFQCKQLAAGLQHRYPTNRWCYCFLLMPYGVSMKLFKKSFQKGWRIFSPPNAEPSKRFLTLTETRSFEHGGYTPLQNEYTRSAAGCG